MRFKKKRVKKMADIVDLNGQKITTAEAAKQHIRNNPDLSSDQIKKRALNSQIIRDELKRIAI